MQIDPSAVAACAASVPAVGAEHEPRPVPYAELADRVAVHGPAAVQGELRHLIRDARHHGVTPLLVKILADPSQPDIARQRAFGRILVALERVPETRSHPAQTEDDAA